MKPNKKEQSSYAELAEAIMTCKLPVNPTEPKPQTPLTDAWFEWIEQNPKHPDYSIFCDARNFARSLELRLQEVKQEIMMLSIDGANKDEQHRKQLQEAERQRDDARQHEDDWKSLGIILSERDQLIRMVDELAKELNWYWEPMQEGMFHPDNPIGQKSFALEHYSLLPHVQAKEKNES